MNRPPATGVTKEQCLTQGEQVVGEQVEDGGEESGGRSCCGDGGCGETGGGGVCCDCGEGERTVGETVGEDGGVCFGGEERDESIKHKHESPLHDAARKKKNIKSKRKK